MSIKIRYTVTVALAICAIGMALMSVPVITGFGETAMLNALAEVPAERLSMSEPVAYVLREYRGKIAVFTPESGSEPAVVTDIDVAVLPEADRIMLHTGIGVREAAALASLLEDYGS